MVVAAYADIPEALREGASITLSPARVAEVFGLPLARLAEMAGVHRNTLRLHGDSPQVQSYLRDLARVLVAMSDIQPNLETAVFHLRNTPVREFDYRTLFEVIEAGCLPEALRYLRSVSSGSAG